MIVIIARSTLIQGPGTRPHRVVLYQRGHPFHPYVVHYEAEEGDRWQGTYTDSISVAAAEFERRCALNEVVNEALHETEAA